MNRWNRPFVFGGALVLNAAFCLLISELLNLLNPDIGLPFVNVIVSLLLFLLVQLVLSGFFGRLSGAMVMTLLLATLTSLVNYFKQYFRGDPFFAGDAVMVGDADKIVVDLRYALEPRLPLAILVLAIGMILAIRLRSRITSPFRRILTSVVSGLLLVSLVTGIIWNGTIRRDWLAMEDYPWNALAGTRENGFLIPFVRSFADLLPQKPPDATIAKTDYAITQPVSAARAEQANVIVVMSEAFSDLEKIRSLKTSEPVMPFYRSLQQDANTIDGSLLVSVFGGSTSCTEFEFLTGSSMYYVNDGLVPYMKWFDEPAHGLADLFNQQGYRSVAIHPFHASYYDRQRVYPLMGFSSYITMEQFPEGAEKVRGFISDQSHVDQIIRTFQEKGPDQRLFLFTISMQNHFPYDHAEEGMASLPYQIRLPDMQDAASAELFLSLMRLSDDALASLVRYADSINEPTMIVIFGDHLPGLSSGFRQFYHDLMGKDFAELGLSETRKMYETPFMIWANYPLPDEDIGLTSPNFLSAKVAELAKADLSPYYQYIGSLNREIMAMSNKILVLKDGTTIDRDHVPAELSDELGIYWSYQYDNIIGRSDARQK